MTAEEPPPGTPSPQPLEELLWRLKARRHELAVALALSIDPDLPVPPSIVAPLAAVETAIQAVRAEIALADLHDGHARQVAVGPGDVGRTGTVVAPPE